MISIENLTDNRYSLHGEEDRIYWDIKKEFTENLKAGDKIVVAHHNRWDEWTTYKIEIIQRITPKRTKIFTNYTEYASTGSFFPLNEVNKKLVEVSNQKITINNQLNELSRLSFKDFNENDYAEIIACLGVVTEFKEKVKSK